MGPYEMAIYKISKIFDRFGVFENDSYIRSEILETSINDVIDNFLDIVDVLREIKDILDNIGGVINDH